MRSKERGQCGWHINATENVEPGEGEEPGRTLVVQAFKASIRILQFILEQCKMIQV